MLNLRGIMANRMLAAQASALIGGLALAGCGGGSGSGTVSTPPPVPVTYTKVADLKGDHTFQTASVQYTNDGTPGQNNGATRAFGSGITLAYTAATDSYKLTAPDGTTTTVTPQNRQPSPPDAPNDRYWSNQDTFEVREFVSLTVPKVNGVALSYTVLASWNRLERSKGYWQYYLGVGGVPTVASDMPRTGSAAYSTVVVGSAVQGGSNYSLDGNSSATFSADFARSSVVTSLTLAGLPQVGGAATPLGTFNGTGTIGSNGPGFTGTLGGNGATGTFAGAFFGPQALEMGYAWFMSGSNFSSAGAVLGVKQ